MACDTTTIPDLTIHTKRKLSQSLAQVNANLQANEWAHEALFAGAIIDDETGKSLEYRDLMKSDKHSKLWAISLANEIGRLAQGICDIKARILSSSSESQKFQQTGERMSRTGAS